MWHAHIFGIYYSGDFECGEWKSNCWQFPLQLGLFTLYIFNVYISTLDKLLLYR